MSFVPQILVAGSAFPLLEQFQLLQHLLVLPLDSSLLPIVLFLLLIITILPASETFAEYSPQ